MYDRKHRTQVAFDAATVAEVMNISLDPRTFSEHLDFATEYQLAMFRFGSKAKRDDSRKQVRMSLGNYSLMQLRALFLFAVVEHDLEIAKGGRLNEMERVAAWQYLARQRWIVFDDDYRLYRATDAAENIKYDF
ncbi:hypothetical protein phiRKBJ001_85 [Streptomyces phage phiRKBJ001]|nr:hypothetical protein phiRKBJ001_85 [Streptomyces phage phiRKBJ001]